MADNENNVEENIQEEGMEEVVELKDKVAKLELDLSDKDDRLKRLMAEFENFKKRSSKEREQLYNSLVGDIMTSILPVMDNLEKAAAAETTDENYKQGVLMVLKQFSDVLNANGVTPIEAVGKTFDPELHEAIHSVQDPELGEKEIKEEFRKGYTIGNKVIRHSMVIVAN